MHTRINDRQRDVDGSESIAGSAREHGPALRVRGLDHATSNRNGCACWPSAAVRLALPLESSTFMYLRRSETQPG